MNTTSGSKPEDTYRWSVRLADFDQVKGTMVNAVERLEYRITYQ